MKLSDVKGVTKLLFRLLPHTHNRELAHFIGRGLSGHNDISLHFRYGIVARVAGVGRHVLNGFFPGPALVVNTGVHHEAHRAEQFRS